MTLALYGKSKRRRGLLLLAAFFAVAIATLGGTAVRNTFTADAADTGFVNGTTASGTCSNPTGSLTAGSLSADCDDGENVVVSGFNLGSVPSNAGDIGFVVSVTGSSSNPGGDKFKAALSWDGGTAYTPQKDSSNVQSSSPDDYGIPSKGECDSFGHNWSVSELSAANFRVRVTADPNSSDPMYIDHVQVKVCWTEPATIPLKTDHVGATNPGFRDENTCPQPPTGMQGYWAWHFVATGKDASFQSISVTFANAGTISGPVPSATILSHPDASHAYLYTPGPDKIVSGSAAIVGGNGGFNLSHVCAGSNREVMFQKVTSTATHPAASFTLDVMPTNDSLAADLAANATVSPKSSPLLIGLGAETASETTPLPDGWTLDGYYVIPAIDLSQVACSNTEPVTGTASIPTQDAKSATNFLVCAKNSYAASSTDGTLTIQKVIKAGSPTENDTTFSGKIDGTDDWSLTGTSGSTGPITVSAGAHTVEEAAPGSGWTTVGWAAADAGVCPTDATAYTGPSISVQVSANANTTVCVMNQKTAVVVQGSLKVTKVAAPGSVTDTTTEFSGKVDSADWGPIGIDETTPPIALDAGTYTVTETAPANGWSTVGFYLAPSSTAGCSTDPNDYTGHPASIDATVSSSATTLVCVMNQKFLPDLQVIKFSQDTSGTTLSGPISLGQEFNWVIKVHNAGGGDATFAPGEVILLDNLPAIPAPTASTSSFGDVDGSFDCALSADGDQWLFKCTAGAAGATFHQDAGFQATIKVKP
ncbi:MAG: hypothetical protein ACM3S1_04700, partial [Hyphomicrobiales bacterium]